MILCREIPTKRIDQVRVHFWRQIWRLKCIKYDLQNSIKYSRDCLLKFITTTFNSCDVIWNLHRIVSQRALQPLYHIIEVLTFKGDIQSEIYQIQTSRASKSVCNACLNPLLKLLRSDLFGIQHSKNRNYALADRSFHECFWHAQFE